MFDKFDLNFCIFAYAILLTKTKFNLMTFYDTALTAPAHQVSDYLFL